MNTLETKIQKVDDTKTDVSCVVPDDIFAPYIKKATQSLAQNAEFPGFRKGHVPEKVLVQKLGEDTILGEAAELAIKEIFPKVAAENKLRIIGRPSITIKKLAKGNPLEFTASVFILPEITLPDYKKIAQEINAKKEEVKVEEKEIEETIETIRKMRAPKKDNGEPDTENLPEVNDEFVKTLGEFKNVADFKEKIKENIAAEKERKNRDKQRMALLDAITDKTKISVPEPLVESELDKMVAQFKDDVARAGGTFEEYLAHIKKTEEEIRKDWRKDAEKRAKFQLILNEIAQKENIQAPKDTLEKNVEFLLKQYKDADPENVRIYVETMLVNEEVFSFLEKQK